MMEAIFGLVYGNAMGEESIYGCVSKSVVSVDFLRDQIQCACWVSISIININIINNTIRIFVYVVVKRYEQDVCMSPIAWFIVLFGWFMNYQTVSGAMPNIRRGKGIMMDGNLLIVGIGGE